MAIRPVPALAAIGLLDMLGLAADPVARVLLGTRFDPRDFVAYATGGLCVLAAARRLRQVAPAWRGIPWRP